MGKIGKSVVAEVAMIGASCRLPGAPSLSAFWELLKAGTNTVRSAPTGRWSISRFLRQGAPEPGFAYTFAGGYIDDPFSFDPNVFGLSPREARQMDPQQRLLLEVAWNAFEDADIPPSTLAGQNVGVFVGASTVDYQSAASHDPSVMESHYMTGNSLSILSNRISYAFDFHGTSFTVDSACSSSFVAVNEAMSALADGRVDLALVAGVNLLLSPAPFIGFSQARMLSPTGLSRPFSQDADGYVRSEGAVVILLRRLTDARANGERIRSVLLGSSVNSDGRTTGISLPSLDGQKRLIDTLYSDIGMDARRLAFVEAHGTGTKVGDPIEARAIGEGLGQKRRDPLLIGSAKSNVGHMECVSGLVGLLKSSLAMQHRLLPRSLFSETLNEAIDFKGLNLSLAQSATVLDAGSAPLVAGICNYGFGGTNAHVVMREGEPPAPADASPSPASPPGLLLVSAATQDALRVRARQLSDLLAHGTSAQDLAATLGHAREIQQHRLALPLANPKAALPALQAFEQGETDIPGAAIASAGWQRQKFAFVYSGNGCQFKDMGRAAYLASAAFRAEIDDIDRLFLPLAGWSLAAMLRDGVEPEALARTSVSQPLIFAIQSALTATLAGVGIRPNLVFGHSVGEVAAAEASGALSRPEAVRVIYLRSKHQEAVRGLGTMLVVAADAARTHEMIELFDQAGIEVAALNSATSTTVSGTSTAIAAFSRLCRSHHLATIKLDIDYPFHSSALDPVEAAITADLSTITATGTTTPFVSTVTGAICDGAALTGAYWWRNIRNPVLFSQAVEYAIGTDVTSFIEIGPRGILTGAMREILRTQAVDGRTLATLSDKDRPDADPVLALVATMASLGLPFDRTAVFGRRPSRRVALPPYPFERQAFTLGGTSEALLAFGKMVDAEPRHALLGARMADGSPEWRGLLDPTLVPYLDDHRVDGGVVVPASGMIEMALQVGRELFGPVPLELDEFDILKAMSISPGETREVSTRWSDRSETIEIWSRKRFSTESSDWLLHARGRVLASHRPRGTALSPPVPAETVRNSRIEVYDEAARAGLSYGPRFQLVRSIERDDVTTDSVLDSPAAGAGSEHGYILHPVSLDAALHGLFISRPQKDGETKAYMPVRFRKVCVFDHAAAIVRSITLLTDETDRFKTVAISLLTEDGTVAASVEAVVLRAVYLSKATVSDRTFHTVAVPLVRPDLTEAYRSLQAANRDRVVNISTSWLLVRAFCVSLAHDIVNRLTEDGADASPNALIASGRVAEAARPYLSVLYDLLSEFAFADNRPGKTAGQRQFPAPTTLLATLMQRFPSANTEIRLAAKAIEYAEPFLRSGEFPPTPHWMVRRFESDSLLIAPTIAALTQSLTSLSDASPTPLRILAIEPFSYGLTRAVTELVETGRISVTFAGANASDVEAQRQDFAVDALVDTLVFGEDVAESPVAYDAMIGLAVSPPAERDAGLGRAVGLLKSAAPVIIGLPGSDASLDMLCGLWQHWLQQGAGDFAVGQIPSEDTVARMLRKAGVDDVVASPTDDGLGRLLFGRAGVRQSDEFSIGDEALRGPIAVIADRIEASRAADYRQVLRVIMTGDQPDAEIGRWFAELAEDVVPTLIVPAHALDAAPAEQLARRVDYLRGLFECVSAAKRKARVFVITESANVGGPANAPVEAGVWAFARVAVNEYPAIDIRLIDVCQGSEIEVIAKVIALPGDEREWRIDATGASAMRVRRGIVRPTPPRDGQRSLLRFEYPGRLDSFVWELAARRTLSAGEIEVEVAVVGLNFRDILVGLGVLDDDLLGAGLTAASLGFECSGVVSRVGPGVSRLKVGDAVMGFAKNAFASHVVTPDWYFYPIPQGVSLEAAATIPVAFATAWYALVDRARLKSGETVLIHGAAGGVGQAAIQIARRLGARVIATASNLTRQRLGRSAGADHLYESRKERFADAIQRDIGGVDVVLNSLAGPAMHASFKLVKPFGRFVELGKRDYLDNTPLSLRPFVRNIQYSGVDLDELLAHDRPAVEALMADLTAALARRELNALPYQIYEAFEVGKAFRTMQASEHVGKILIRPPRSARPDLSLARFAVKPGAYLITGGTTGFGFQTARWLAARGATSLILVSRRGVVEPEADAIVAQMRDSGIRVQVESLDVRDGVAVQALVDRVAADHGPIRGVVHAAVQLEDGLISSLTEDRLRRVLGAKVEGALHLDRATAGQPLDFFVVYSSATTLIGSPGQGAYVAANGFLEGFTRRRRAEGKPALAIGWGAISDAGLIARDRGLGERLRRTTGVVGIRSSEALAQLGRLLALGDAADPIQFYTNIAPGEAAAKLSLINSPAFAGLGLARRADGGETSSDLTSLIAGKSESEALDLVTQAMRREVAHILRMPEAQIDLSRPLSELGLDSLMALELQLGIERLSGAQVPMVGINNRRLTDLASLVLTQLGTDMGGADATPINVHQQRILSLAEIHSASGLSAEEANAVQVRLKRVAASGAE